MKGMGKWQPRPKHQLIMGGLEMGSPTQCRGHEMKGAECLTGYINHPGKGCTYLGVCTDRIMGTLHFGGILRFQINEEGSELRLLLDIYPRIPRIT